MKKKSASLWILILLIISSLTAPAEAAPTCEKKEECEPVKPVQELYRKYFDSAKNISRVLGNEKEGRDSLVYKTKDGLYVIDYAGKSVLLTKYYYSGQLEAEIKEDEGSPIELIGYAKGGRILLVPENMKRYSEEDLRSEEGSYLDSSYTRSLEEKRYRKDLEIIPYKDLYTMALFSVDLEDGNKKVKIDENIVYYQADEKKRVIYYEKTKKSNPMADGLIYRYDFAEKEKVAEGKLQAVSSDGNTILYIKSDVLYKKRLGEEPIEIAEGGNHWRGVLPLPQFDKSLDTVFYLIPGNGYEGRLYKKEGVSPPEKVLTEVGFDGFAYNRIDKNSARKGKGKFYYYKQRPEVAGEGGWSDYLEDDIMEENYVKMTEDDRKRVEILRNLLSSDEEKILDYGDLYFYDGKRNHLVEKGVLNSEFYTASERKEVDEAERRIYTIFVKNKRPKFKFSEVIRKVKEDPDDRNEYIDEREIESLVESMIEKEMIERRIYERGKFVGRFVDENLKIDFDFWLKGKNMVVYCDRGDTLTICSDEEMIINYLSCHDEEDIGFIDGNQLVFGRPSRGNRSLLDLFIYDGEKEYPVVRGIEWFTVVGADEEFGIRY